VKNIHGRPRPIVIRPGDSVFQVARMRTSSLSRNLSHVRKSPELLEGPHRVGRVDRVSLEPRGNSLSAHAGAATNTPSTNEADDDGLLAERKVRAFGGAR